MIIAIFVQLFLNAVGVNKQNVVYLEVQKKLHVLEHVL